MITYNYSGDRPLRKPPQRGQPGQDGRERRDRAGRRSRLWGCHAAADQGNNYIKVIGYTKPICKTYIQNLYTKQGYRLYKVIIIIMVGAPACGDLMRLQIKVNDKLYWKQYTFYNNKSKHSNSNIYYNTG